MVLIEVTTFTSGSAILLTSGSIKRCLLKSDTQMSSLKGDFKMKSNDSLFAAEISISMDGTREISLL